jgi:hypothetical protein
MIYLVKNDFSIIKSELKILQAIKKMKKSIFFNIYNS